MPKPLEVFRAIAYMLLTVVAGFISTAILLVALPFRLIFDKDWRFGHHVTCGCMHLLGKLFLNVEVSGIENAPQPFRKIVVVANHQSTLDMAVMSATWFLPYEVVYKRELLLYPGVGTAMFLAGYLSVNRKDKDSGRNLIETCKSELNKGRCVQFFPEGTRNSAISNSPLGPFKAGAFKAAVETGADVLPVTISGARKLFPNKGWPALGFGNPHLTIHPIISSAGKTVEQLSEECRAAIISGLRDVDFDPGMDRPPASTSPSVRASAATNTAVEAKKEL